MKKQNYLHGFNKIEQDRLAHQARFLEPYVYSGVNLEFLNNLLEVGCGIGAQSEILLRRFPDLKIHGVDFSQEQLSTAQIRLKQQIKEGRIHLEKQDAQKLKLNRKNFDAAFLCWFLEHVPNPLQALISTRKHLKSGAKIYCSEVFNQTLFMEPYCPAYLNYWFQFNDYQYEINGHPFIGANLGNLLKQAGFVDIQTEIRPFHFDSREPEKRAAFTQYFFNILLSAEQTLLDEKRVTKQQIAQMKKEVEQVKKSKDSVFFYSFMRAVATAP